MKIIWSASLFLLIPCLHITIINVTLNFALTFSYFKSQVCANHTITPAMQLKAMETSDRAWVYNAIDFSDGEASPELLAIKFKNIDIAREFKDKFEECQVDIAQLPAKQQEVKVEEKPKVCDDRH